MYFPETLTTDESLGVADVQERHTVRALHYALYTMAEEVEELRDVDQAPGAQGGEAPDGGAPTAAVDDADAPRKTRRGGAAQPSSTAAPPPAQPRTTTTVLRRRMVTFRHMATLINPRTGAFREQVYLTAVLHPIHEEDLAKDEMAECVPAARPCRGRDRARAHAPTSARPRAAAPAPPLAACAWSTSPCTTGTSRCATGTRCCTR